MKPMFILGLLALFGINALIIFGIGDLMPWNCEQDYGHERYYVNQCLQMRIMGMVPPLIGYAVGFFLVFYDKESLQQVKKWQSALICTLFVLMFFIPSWQLFFEIDCPNEECSNLKTTITLLELVIIPLTAFIGYTLPRNNRREQQKVRN